MVTIDLIAGEEYQICTFYNFKVCPYNGKFLGNVQFKEESRAVFKRTSGWGSKDPHTDEYLFLILDVGRCNVSSRVVYSDLERDEDSEIVLIKDENGVKDNWVLLNNQDRSKLVEELKKMGELS